MLVHQKAKGEFLLSVSAAILLKTTLIQFKVTVQKYHVSVFSRVLSSTYLQYINMLIFPDI